jgi:capsular exopolysaccharide synthesis family protein
VIVNVEATAGSPAAAARLADELDAGLLKFAKRPLGDGEEGLPTRVTVTTPARRPDERSSPRTPIYVALGLLLGLAAGIAAAVLRDGLDPRARVEDDAVAAASAPVLARIPRDDSADGDPASPTDPSGKRAEAYRALRANLRAVSSEHDLRSFVLSSATSGAGTTDVVIGLGIAFAQASARVALVDADLRAPKLANRLGIASGVGLTDLLREGTAASLALRRGPEATLKVIPGGEAVGHPGDLLESDALAEVLDELSRAFDIVLIDTPPLLFASDAASVARRASAAVLVARSGVTATEKLRLAERALRAVGKPPLGVVLNDVTARDERIHRKEPVPARRNRLRTAARAQARRKESGRSLHW